jgi:phosphocarrier protein HPr
MPSVSTNDWVERRISLRNKHHLHMRPAQKIVETASRFQSEIRAVKDHLDLSAKSILDMIEFAAHMVNRASQDDNDFVFRARGPDAQQALEALDRLVEERFGLD